MSRLPTKRPRRDEIRAKVERLAAEVRLYRSGKRESSEIY